ncbi:uncharacterized protein LOC134538799 isoform X2 [Bacillus rossius redtenbacheri]|uniref:uncharacterized protein LOC134538799 isoform X2 n=1 Tax=Bacillus rossius redtenbacheri TaxID=93214 RepID=UPI002FDD1C47
MSSVMGSEDCDIYTDLPAIYNAEYEEENNRLKEKIKILEAKLKSAEKEKHHLKEKCVQVQKNISSLFKTAVTEVNRKKRTIDDLRTQLENSVFHRNKKRRTCSPVHEKTKNETVRRSDAKQKQFSDSDDVSVIEVRDPNSLDSVNWSDGPGKASDMEMQGTQITSSHLVNRAVSTNAHQSYGSKRHVNPTKISYTVYTQRQLNRTTGQRKDQQQSVVNKPDSVERNKDASPKPPVSESTRLTESKQDYVSVGKNPSFERDNSCREIHKVDKSEDSTLQKDEDCVVLDTEEESSSTSKTFSSQNSCYETSKNWESHARIKRDYKVNDITSFPAVDFGGRSKAKVVNASSGNKFVFSSPVCSVNDICNMGPAAGNSTLNMLSIDKVSFPASKQQSHLAKGTLKPELTGGVEGKSSETSQISGVRCSVGDNSKDEHKYNFDFREIKSAVELVSGRCENLSIVCKREVVPSSSDSQKKITISKRDEDTSKGSQTIKNDLCSAESLNTKCVNTEKEDHCLVSEINQNANETKQIIISGRRRNRVCLGDSSEKQVTDAVEFSDTHSIKSEAKEDSLETTPSQNPDTTKYVNFTGRRRKPVCLSDSLEQSNPAAESFNVHSLKSENKEALLESSPFENDDTAKFTTISVTRRKPVCLGDSSEEKFNVAAESFNINNIKSEDSETSVEGTLSRNSDFKKCITFSGRRRKPVCLGDSGEIQLNLAAESANVHSIKSEGTESSSDLSVKSEPKEALLESKPSRNTDVTKHTTVFGKRRKPVFLGDSSFVVANMPKI